MKKIQSFSRRFKTGLFVATLGLMVTACDIATWQYGYYWNPVQCLSQALEAVEQDDLNLFTEVVSSGAMTRFASDDGIQKIKSHLIKAGIRSTSDAELVGPVKTKESQKDDVFQELYVAKVMKAGRAVTEIKILCETWKDQSTRQACSIFEIRLN